MFEKLVKTTWRSAGRQSFKAGKEQSGCLLASAVEAAARKSNLIFAQHSESKTVIPMLKKLKIQKISYLMMEELKSTAKPFLEGQ